MATFITLVRFTQQGVTTFRDTCQRAANFKTTARKLGVKVKEVYWTLGAFDGVAVFEADDDETATAAMVQLASQGNVQTQTARAFTAAEMETILGRIAK